MCEDARLLERMVSANMQCVKRVLVCTHSSCVCVCLCLFASTQLPFIHESPVGDALVHLIGYPQYTANDREHVWRWVERERVLFRVVETACAKPANAATGSSGARQVSVVGLTVGTVVVSVAVRMSVDVQHRRAMWCHEFWIA